MSEEFFPEVRGAVGFAGSRADRYAGWDAELGRSILAGEVSLATLADRVLAGGVDARPVSGRQERLENAVNQAIWRTR